MSIIVSHNNKNAKRLDKQEFGLEREIQQYIYDNPDIIPVYEINSDTRLFVAAREFQTNSGAIDALAFDQNGNIYVIETKLFRNPDKRTVVAQALDYGASLWRHSTDFGAFIEQLDRHADKRFNKDFKEAFADFFGIEDTSEVFATISGNLNSGNIKFVVLMDKLHSQLKDLIVYVNQNSHFDIYAVEVEYYKYKDLEIIIPKLYGAEIKKEVVSKRSGNGNYNYSITDRQAFLDDVKNHSEQLSETAISAMSDVLTIFEKITEQYDAELHYYKSEKANRFIATIRDIDGKMIISEYSSGEIWVPRQDAEESDNARAYTRRVLNRLIDEKLFDKTEKHLSATQWAVMMTRSKNDASIDQQLVRLVKILNEEIK